MNHMVSGRKLGVNSPKRTALLRSLTLAILEHEEIETTQARAKELRWYADHVVTLAKRGDLGSRRQIVQLLGSTQTNIPNNNRVRLAMERLYAELVPRFKTRNGGYTQIFRLARRRPGDNAEMCYIRYLPAPDSKDKKSGKKESGKTAASKPQAKAKASSKKEAAEPQDKPATAKKRAPKREKETAE